MAETDPRLAALERRWLEEPSPAASMPLAEEFRRLGRHREAVAVLESALRAQPRHTAAQVALGRCLLECERPDQATAVLQDILRRDPEQLVANRLLVDALIQRRDVAGSRRQLAAYESLNRRDPALEARRYLPEPTVPELGAPCGKGASGRRHAAVQSMQGLCSARHKRRNATPPVAMIHWMRSAARRRMASAPRIATL